MRSNRLWPVLTALAVLLAGVGALEWVAARHEGYYERVVVADSTGTDDDSEEVADLSWQASLPTSPEHARARQLLRRGEVEEALGLYQTLVDAESAPVPLLIEYGYALRRSGRCRDAGPVVESALERAPDDAAVNLAAGLTFRCLNRREEAVSAFERALELRPNHAVTRLSYGELLARLGDLDRAIAVLEPAATSGSNEERARALTQLGRCLFERGDRQRARAALDEAIERAPAYVAIWLSVSRTYRLSDLPEDRVRALHYARQATRLAPELATAQSAAGRAYEQLGLRREAIDSYSQAAELDSGYEYPRIRLVRLALEEEEYALARRSARGLLQIDPTRADYHFLHGLAAGRSGDSEAARTSYMEAIQLRDGDYAEAWYNLGILEREAEQLAEAEAAYRRALAARPEYEAAWNNLGLVYLDQGRLAEAESAFQSALTLRADYASAWINLGKTYAEQNRYDLAADAYDRALRIAPDNRTVRLRLGVAYRRTGRAEEAILLYRELVEDQPRYVAAWYNLGIALASIDRDPEAREAYQTALAIDPDHRQSLRNLGLLEARTGNRSLAFAHLTDALDRDPADYRVRLGLAELALGNDDLDRCAREARIVLAQSPDNPRALTLLGSCAEHGPTRSE